MACGARSGLKQIDLNEIKRIQYGLNGLWSPFGIETAFSFSPFCHSLWLNGLWSPFEGRK